MKIAKLYQNAGIPANKLHVIRDYLNDQSPSHSRGEAWGHKIWGYVLHYPQSSEVIKCENYDEVSRIISARGDTFSHETYFESITGRFVRIDATNPTRIIVEASNGDLTLKFLERIEQLLGLKPLQRFVFVSHGRSLLWLEVRNFVEKESHLNIGAIELAGQPNSGRTISQKLDQESNQCSYAIIVMTGDDVTAEGELRARENVMHEIGFFQGRYGVDRVCLLREAGVNIPSNLDGLAYYEFPKDLIKAAFSDLLKDLRAAFA